MITTIYFCQNAQTFISKEINQWPGIETGGGLFGYHDDNCVVITHACGPGPKARRKRTSVTIEGHYIRNWCRSINEMTDGRLYYLGDWHVHPIGNLLPSGDDITAALKLLRANSTPMGFVISMILAPDFNNLPRAYIFDGNSQMELTVKRSYDPIWTEDYDIE